MQKVISDDLDAFLDILPPHIRQPLQKEKDNAELVEVVLDLGRLPEARYSNRELVLSPKEISDEDTEYVASRIGSFGDDNRAGIERTLHRISAIRNRMGRIVGLTCRVGRAVFGTIQIIEDLLKSGDSILLLGRPGIGKTTMLREAARVLADEHRKRVVIVDTSNEIAGDGDIPHPAIGRARRMQVSTPSAQHTVMIEAVENHMPQVIVIDEMGTELEAQAARTIAERGVQLIATAHGNTLENLMMNPTLCDLVGGIQSVTLGDEEAKRRGTQKSILERKSPPTFDVLVEIQSRDRVAVHSDVAEMVDALLRGQPAPAEIRWLDEEGCVQHEMETPPEVKRTAKSKPPVDGKRPPKLYLFGVNRGRLEQIAEESRLKLDVTDSLKKADLFVTSKSYYRRRMTTIKEAEKTGLPIYVLRSNTPPQIRRLLQDIAPRETVGPTGPMQRALGEAEEAASKVAGGEEAVDLSPQSAYIRRLQHLIAERHSLLSQSTGKEPQRRVRIYR